MFAVHILPGFDLFKAALPQRQVLVHLPKASARKRFGSTSRLIDKDCGRLEPSMTTI
jgi:hypothetical protein